MKLTEAQLKRIIEEEIQMAIDEGILDWFSGSRDAGSYKPWAGPGSSKPGISDRLKGVAGRLKTAISPKAKALGGAAIDTMNAAGETADTALSSVKTADQAIVNAIYASSSKASQRLVQKIGTTVNKLADELEQITQPGVPQDDKRFTKEDADRYLLTFFETLAGSVGKSIEDLVKLQKSVNSKEAPRVYDPESDRDIAKYNRRQSAVAARGGISTSASGIGSTRLEEQADAITEAILKRITQKR